MVWERLVFCPGEAAAIEPHGDEAGRFRAPHVTPQAVSHVPYVLRVNAELIDCDSKDGGIGFGDANLCGDNHRTEDLLDAQRAERITRRIGCAVRDERPPDPSAREPSERTTHGCQ